ncbi:hypothetical protein FSP39_002315 [Pinctada imbricata]|uniref:MutS protein homolog 5 n=1 Tax=Pinctada imbricata TaxID=66713 RepID=A0AA88Y4G2_PINIB|nr:hypothetical protein FSP39_002315 [Pinctada imbricata]
MSDVAKKKRRTGSSSVQFARERQVISPPDSGEDRMTSADIHTIRSVREEEPTFDQVNAIKDHILCIYISLMWHGGKLGIACYNVDTSVMSLMLDVLETDSFTFLKRVFRQVQPVCVVLSTKQDDRLVSVLKSTLNTESTVDASNSDGNQFLQFLPSIDFSLDICKRRILFLDLPAMPKHYTESEKTIYLSSLVPFENVNTIRAAGGLLKFLEKNRIGVELEESSVSVPVIDIQFFSLDDQLVLDDTAFSALQIFEKESHPSVYKVGQGSSKEGLSLFGIMNRCKSPTGSKLMRLWFLRPLRDLDILRQRQEAIAFFVEPRNIEAVSTLTNCLKNIKNIAYILKRMQRAQATVNDWQALYKTAYHAMYIRDICRQQSQKIHIFQKITSTFSESLYQVATLINRIVDLDESITQSRFVVKSNVDSTLDEKKRIYNGLPELMTTVANEELNELSEDIRECNVIYLPQIGYLLAIPLTETLKSGYEIPGLEFKFITNNVLHYKSARTIELDTVLGDHECDIKDQEMGIMRKLQNNVLQHAKSLMEVIDLCAELDCLLSLAACAQENNYVRPTLSEENIIKIEGGRHPIQEMCCSPFVPNSTMSCEEESKIKVLTGPNACGKSVYLKQVALIVYMAHIGSYVPAKSAVIGCIDRIYTRIRSMESVSDGLSTFMIDVNQVAEALRNATSKSLVVVDEFGKGTEMVDGVALLCSSLIHWIGQGKACPHVLVSTHFHSIIHQHLLPQSPLIKYMTFETLHEDGELLFLYQLIEGHTNSSYACHIATLAGQSKEIVRRGSQVSELIRQNKPVDRADSIDSDAQIKRNQLIVKKFLELDLDKDNLQSFLTDFVLKVDTGQM